MTSVEKQKATWEKKRQLEAERKEERKRQRIALQEIRDNPQATPSDRLRAIELLNQI